MDKPDSNSKAPELLVLEDLELPCASKKQVASISRICENGAPEPFESNPVVDTRSFAALTVVLHQSETTRYKDDIKLLTDKLKQSKVREKQKDQERALLHMQINSLRGYVREVDEVNATIRSSTSSNLMAIAAIVALVELMEPPHCFAVVNIKHLKSMRLLPPAFQIRTIEAQQIVVGLVQRRFFVTMVSDADKAVGRICWIGWGASGRLVLQDIAAGLDQSLYGDDQGAMEA